MGELGDVWDKAANATEVRVGDGGTPSNEERLIAASTYLMAFVGFWVVGALLIYFWQRKNSAFVARHAIQSVVLQVWITIAVTAAAVVGFVGVLGSSIALSALSGHNTSGEQDWVAFLLFGGMGVLYAFILLAPLYWQLRGAWVAAHGGVYHAPMVGSLADKLMDSPAGT